MRAIKCYTMSIKCELLQVSEALPVVGVPFGRREEGCADSPVKDLTRFWVVLLS